MTATATKLPANVQRILDAGSVAYVPGGIKKYSESDGIYGIERKIYTAVEVRDCRVPTESGRFSCIVKALVVTRPDSGIWDHQVTPIVEDVEGGDRYQRYTKTGEYCIPLKSLGLHWVDGNTFEAERTARRERAERSLKHAERMKTRRETLEVAFREALGLAPERYEVRVEVDHAGVTLKYAAFEAICAKLGIDPMTGK